MSNDCTSGIPAVIMVASWRENTAISAAVTLPCLRNSMLCLRTRVATTPWRRNSERTAASLVATTLPLTFLPVRSVPSHVKGNWFAATVAMFQWLQRSTRNCGGPSWPTVLFNCNAIDLFETGKTVLDFLQRGLAQVGDAFLLRGGRDLHRVAA